MYTKAIALSSIAALAGQAVALNPHRHHHQHERRVMVTDWVTVIDTVTVYAGEDAAAATSSVMAAKEYSAPASPTTSSTSTVVVPTTSSKSPAYVPPPSSPPPPKPTTLTTSVKPAPPPPTSSPYKAPPAPSSPPPPKPTYQAPAPKPSSSKPAPPAPKPSASPPPASNPSPGGGLFGSKRGLAYNDPLLAAFFGNECGSCDWAYNWGSTSDGLSSKYHYIPMLWSPSPLHSIGFDALAEVAIATGSKALFSFNEPDNAGQANMSPQDAASAHAQYFNKYAGKAMVGAPAVTNSQSPGQGISWLKSFMSACESQGGCQVDFCNVHWYSPCSAADTLFDHLEQAHEACGGKPVVLSEFAPSGSDEEIASFLKTVLPKLDALPYLGAYSYFMVSASSLMTSSSSLSIFGQLYASL